eukprot:Opistho-1_new@70094
MKLAVLFLLALVATAYARPAAVNKRALGGNDVEIVETGDGVIIVSGDAQFGGDEAEPDGLPKDDTPAVTIPEDDGDVAVPDNDGEDDVAVPDDADDDDDVAYD